MNTVLRIIDLVDRGILKKNALNYYASDINRSRTFLEWCDNVYGKKSWDSGSLRDIEKRCEELNLNRISIQVLPDSFLKYWKK